MKYIFLILDGAADRPIAELGNKTPLQVAKIPNINSLAKYGTIGTVRTVPLGMESGSDVCILALLGFDPLKYYTGRGPLEAASLGIELKENEVAFRCNVVTKKDDLLLDYSAGHIETSDAKILIKLINEKLGNPKIKFYPGISYRHLMVWSGGSSLVKCTPPHDIYGKKYTDYLPKGRGEKILHNLIEDSFLLLDGHEINRERRREGKNPANMIWLWGAGKSPILQTYKERFNIEGSVITAVDLVKGIGKYLGLDIINVPGVTGYLDTNYIGKAEAALKSLNKKDFVLVHVEAADETGHNGDLQGKIKAIEDFDEKVVGTILKGLTKFGEYKILIAPDHPTPISVRTHTKEAVPWLMYSSIDKKPLDENLFFNEIVGEKSNLHINNSSDLIEMFLKK
ncbi:MAG: cofactor-independent phosphoglycerate mutase [Candidatus Firestonebacteria bacterium]